MLSQRFVSQRKKTQTRPFEFSCPNTQLQHKSAEKKLNFNKDEILAVRNESGGFYLCRTLQNVYNSTGSIKIQWLEAFDDAQTTYHMSYADKIESKSILASVNIKRLTNKTYNLPSHQMLMITRLLKKSVVDKNGKLVGNDHEDEVIAGQSNEGKSLKVKRTNAASELEGKISILRNIIQKHSFKKSSVATNIITSNVRLKKTAKNTPSHSSIVSEISEQVTLAPLSLQVKSKETVVLTQLPLSVFSEITEQLAVGPSNCNSKIETGRSADFTLLNSEVSSELSEQLTVKLPHYNSELQVEEPAYFTPLHSPFSSEMFDQVAVTVTPSTPKFQSITTAKLTSPSSIVHSELCVQLALQSPQYNSELQVEEPADFTPLHSPFSSEMLDQVAVAAPSPSTPKFKSITTAKLTSSSSIVHSGMSEQLAVEFPHCNSEVLRDETADLTLLHTGVCSETSEKLAVESPHCSSELYMEESAYLTPCHSRVSSETSDQISIDGSHSISHVQVEGTGDFTQLHSSDVSEVSDPVMVALSHYKSEVLMAVFAELTPLISTLSSGMSNQAEVAPSTSTPNLQLIKTAELTPLSATVHSEISEQLFVQPSNCNSIFKEKIHQISRLHSSVCSELSIQVAVAPFESSSTVHVKETAKRTALHSSVVYAMSDHAALAPSQTISKVATKNTAKYTPPHSVVLSEMTDQLATPPPLYNSVVQLEGTADINPPPSSVSSQMSDHVTFASSQLISKVQKKNTAKHIQPHSGNLSEMPNQVEVAPSQSSSKVRMKMTSLRNASRSSVSSEMPDYVPAAACNSSSYSCKTSAGVDIFDTNSCGSNKSEEIPFPLVDTNCLSISDDSLNDPDYESETEPCSSSSESEASIRVLAMSKINKVIPDFRSFDKNKSTLRLLPVSTAQNSYSVSEFTEPLSSSLTRLNSVPHDATKTKSVTPKTRLVGDEVVSNELMPEINGIGCEQDLVLVPNEDASEKEHTSKKRKIARPCLFCGSFQTNLHRHIVSKHKEEKDVESALMLPKNGQTLAFARFRKQGILQYNKKQMIEDNPMYVRERSLTKDKNLVMCGSCNAFCSKSYFHRHRKLCMADSAEMSRPLPVKLLNDGVKYSTVSDTFKTEILGRFHDTPVGKLCQNDNSLVTFGSRLFNKTAAKKDKVIEVRKSVMSDMRRLGHLYIEFSKLCEIEGKQTSGASDMLCRANFQLLTQSIEKTTSSENNEIKAGIKYGIYYLLKNFAKVMKATHLINDQDSTAAEIDKFLDVFALNKNFIFGDATYLLNRNRQVKLRRPEALPTEKDVEKLKQYTVDRIATIIGDPYNPWSSTEFVELRDLAVSRLTLFNARRGGEPARMTINEWREADTNVWLRKTIANKDGREEANDELEQKLFNDMKLTYQSGKGNNHLVPVLIPVDTIAAMQKLSDEAVRESGTVLSNNPYMFPSTHSSNEHVSGWHAVRRVCKDAQVEDPEKLTATKMRHRISTLYAGLDLTPNERQLFYKHMGHAETINQNVYQTPLAEAEILSVGAQLKKIDESNTFARTVTPPSSTGVANSGAESIVSQSPRQRLNIQSDKVGKGVANSEIVSADKRRSTRKRRQPMDFQCDEVEKESDSEDVESTDEEDSDATPPKSSRKRGRGFTRWSQEETKLVRMAFQHYIYGEGLPGKEEILRFKAKHTALLHDWSKVYIKVFNERKTLREKASRRMERFEM